MCCQYLYCSLTLSRAFTVVLFIMQSDSREIFPVIVRPLREEEEEERAPLRVNSCRAVSDISDSTNQDPVHITVSLRLRPSKSRACNLKRSMCSCCVPADHSPEPLLLYFKLSVDWHCKICGLCPLSVLKKNTVSESDYIPILSD
jgi:hypothetical protein